MRLRPACGRGGYWLRQPSDTSEGSIAAILDTMVNDGGGGYFSPKVADGLNFQGANDASYACNSLQDIIDLRDYCWSRSLGFLPVVVPRGRIGEAEFHAAIAVACGCLMVDIEPYAGFWDKSPFSLIPVYWQALRAASGDAYLIAQPDPRSFGWTAGMVEQSAASFDAICAQHYVGWTGVGWTDVDHEVAVFNSIASLGKEMYATLYTGDPSNSAANVYATSFWNRIAEKALGWNAFALGPANLRQLEAIGSLQNFFVAPDPIQPQPDPPTPPTPPTPPGPTPLDVDWNFRVTLGEFYAANTADLLDQDQTLDDILPLLKTTAQAAVDLLATR